MSKVLKLAGISISSVLGIEEMQITPGRRMTILRGGNGTGKSSVIEAVKAALGGGKDASLIHKGAAEGRVVLVLEDEHGFRTNVTKRIGQDSASVTVEQDRGDDIWAKVSSPQGYLNKLADALTTNPVALLTAKPADRLRMVLEALPIHATPEHLQAAIGDTTLEACDLHLNAIQKSEHALTTIATYRKAIYDERAVNNRAAKEKRATVEQLSRSLPADDMDRDDLINSLDDLEAQREALVKQLRDVENQLSAGRERMRVVDQLDNTRQTIKTLSGTADDCEAMAAEMTRSVEGLDELKVELLRTLPIPGVTVGDDDIEIDGVTFERVNTARRVEFAFQLAAQRAGDLRLVCLDGMEVLDATTFAAVCDEAEKSKLQMIGTVVANGANGQPMPLTVETV